MTSERKASMLCCCQSRIDYAGFQELKQNQILYSPERCCQAWYRHHHASHLQGCGAKSRYIYIYTYTYSFLYRTPFLMHPSSVQAAHPCWEVTQISAARLTGHSAQSASFHTPAIANGVLLGVLCNFKHAVVIVDVI